MILSRLSILNYKNIAEASLEFSPKVNCLLGNNGMGKTNVLDAVFYMSFAKAAKLVPTRRQYATGRNSCCCRACTNEMGRRNKFLVPFSAASENPSNETGKNTDGKASISGCCRW